MITKLSKKQIKLVIETSENTAEALVTLHRLVVPNFDNLPTVKNPQANMKTNTFIMNCMIDKDIKQKVTHMKGGNWLNWGFSTDDSLEDMEVRYDTTTTH